MVGFPNGTSRFSVAFRAASHRQAPLVPHREEGVVRGGHRMQHNILQTGQVAWYVTGRFYVDAQKNAFDAGYFPIIKGIDAPFFKGATTHDETTAHFTFSAEKFTATSVSNGDVSMGIYPPGDWHLYYNPTPSGDFSAPDTFSQGQKIATFRREGSTSGIAIGSASVSVLTFGLEHSSPFAVGGVTYDMKDLIPNGVTQVGYGSGSLQPGLPDYPEIQCFGGTALSITQL